MAHSPFPARHAAAAVLLLFASAAAAGPAFAQAPAPPIEIKTCTILQAAHPELPFWYPFGPTVVINTPVADGIRIDYVNHAPQPADRVVFVVDYRGDTQRIIDVGRFAPNVTIDHTFGNFSGDAYLGPNPNACAVRAVRYIDYTVWRAP
ncbi:MAG TPA: hypothetical protein VGX96_02355 [Candidatus Elarobacter sp.]|jgi:hypothetical protein|nr:hypothetical protein [Candidatus Elarobacter sp.]